MGWHRANGGGELQAELVLLAVVLELAPPLLALAAELRVVRGVVGRVGQEGTAAARLRTAVVGALEVRVVGSHAITLPIHTEMK